MRTSVLSPQDMTTYLKAVLDTESSLFRQLVIRQEAQNSLRYEEPKKNTVKKPDRKTIDRPKPPEQTEITGGTVLLIILGFLAAPLAILFALFALSAIMEQFFLSVIMLLLSAFIGICSYIGIGGAFAIWEERKNWPQTIEAHNEQLKRYEQQAAEAKAEYAEAYRLYEQDVAEEEQRFKLAVAAAQNRYETACNQVMLLAKPIEETKEILQRLYEMDIVFPKYQNFPAICTFYEYFASGRCSELQGPNGAYNMYETELRQNLIINKLDGILGQLDSIKQNQFVLYQEIKRAADVLPALSRDMSNMLDATKEISQSSTIAAQCADTAAQNAQILKYLAFIKR